MSPEQAPLVDLKDGFPRRMPGEAPALLARNVSKIFGTTKVLDDVTLAVMPGEVHGLLGANGSGKSTFIKTIAASVRQLRATPAENVSFYIREGEILGLTGLIGSGFYRVPEAIFGAQKDSDGTLEIGGKSFALNTMSPGKAMGQGVAFLPADRLGRAGIGTLSIAENMILPVMGEFWRTLGERAIGATLVTTDSATGPNGFLGLSASHVTANPPTMIVSIDKKTSALQGVLDKGHFAVNFLPEGYAELANAFGGKGEKLFEDGKWDTLATGAPVLKDALGVFDCEVEKVVEHGDISIIIGAVKGVRAAGTGEPLVFFRGKFLSD